MTEALTLAVFGATGATGAEVVRQAAARGHRVRAIEPGWPDDPGLPEGVETRVADVLTDDLSDVIAGCDVVISAIGLGLSPRTVLSPPPLYTEGALHMIDAMRAQGLSRLIVVSASFVETLDRGPHWFRATTGLALERVFTQMGEMERILRAAGDIDWTAVRPGWLMQGDLTADYTVTPDVIPQDLIRTRHADLAHFILHCAETGDWSRATPAIARAEPASATRPDTVLKELLPDKLRN
ncbi:NAD(P)H-binding protein [Maribius pontilimi]|uniref:NAD(P)H-binding protein n=1 Tax=Palleronia pontilimi TaxID=1964209 RepID=A0A934IFR7_9RHOB|nr:NAD(P)H-binding protein [Palleronia pontilimi]MBJ3762625.1 NAD(P)H-binding protein [Palleronia pontilimi]